MERILVILFLGMTLSGCDLILGKTIVCDTGTTQWGVTISGESADVKVRASGMDIEIIEDEVIVDDSEIRAKGKFALTAGGIDYLLVIKRQDESFDYSSGKFTKSGECINAKYQ